MNTKHLFAIVALSTIGATAQSAPMAPQPGIVVAAIDVCQPSGRCTHVTKVALADRHVCSLSHHTSEKPLEIEAKIQVRLLTSGKCEIAKD
jgi:hypothetical protein